MHLDKPGGAHEFGEGLVRLLDNDTLRSQDASQGRVARTLGRNRVAEGSSHVEKN